MEVQASYRVQESQGGDMDYLFKDVGRREPQERDLEVMHEVEGVLREDCFWEPGGHKLP